MIDLKRLSPPMDHWAANLIHLIDRKLDVRLSIDLNELWICHAAGLFKMSFVDIPILHFALNENV